MTDIEKLIKLLEHAESFSLEAYGKSPNLSECSLNIQYLRACILQAIGNAKALRERLANDKTDIELMQQALDSMMDAMRVSGGISDKMFESVNAISERLAQPDPLQRLTNVQQEIEAALAPEQKPVAQMREMLEVQGRDGTWDCDTYSLGMYNGMEFMVALAEGREPVFRGPPERWLHTPQQREWQGLTDEEISAISKSIPGGTEVNLAKRLFAREIEDKLKEKNT